MTFAHGCKYVFPRFASRLCRCACPLLAAVILASAGNPTVAAVIDTASFDGHSYSLLSQNTWTGAEAEAISLGGHLAAINSSAENDFIFSRWGGPLGMWIGLSDQAVEGVFTWSNGDPLTFSFWADGEPNNLGNEDFVEIVDTRFAANGRWNDLPNGGSVLGLLFGVAELPTQVAEPPALPLGLAALFAFIALRRRTRSRN